MKKILTVAALVIAAMVMFSACGSEGGDSEKKEYVKDEEISKVLKDSTEYKGKYIKLAGKITEVEADGEIVGILAQNDVDKYDDDFIAYMKSDEKFSRDDIVLVEGKIEGPSENEKLFPYNSDVVRIAADKIEKSTYAEAIAPAKETRKVDKTEKQKGLSLTVSKVEFAEKETRIYVTVKNETKAGADVFTTLAKIVQDGKQLEAESNYNADYPEVSEIAAGAEKDGIICCKPLDPEKEIQIIVDAFSDDYDLGIKAFDMKF